MSKKSKSTTNQTTVQTPTNPEWVTQPTQDVAGKISALGNLDPYSLVAGADPLQTQAGQGAAGLGQDRGWYDKIMGGSSASLLDGLGSYMSPYTQNVVDTSLADFDHNAGQTRAQQTLDMAGSGAFGGSGSALTRSGTEGELARARASLDAGLRDQAFNTGAGLSNQDASRRQDFMGLQAQTGLAAEESQRSNLALQSDIGEKMRAIEQARLGAPISLAQIQAGLLSGLPLNLFTGQTSTMNGTTTSKTSDPLGTLGSLAMTAAAPFTGGASLAGLGGLFAGAGALKKNAASLAGSNMSWGS